MHYYPKHTTLLFIINKYRYLMTVGISIYLTGSYDKLLKWEIPKYRNEFIST